MMPSVRSRRTKKGPTADLRLIFFGKECGRRQAPGRPDHGVMKLQQISVFIENRKGTLLRVSRILAGAGVDLRALFVPDTVDFGILRCLVSDVPRAVAALEAEGASCSVTDVLGVSIGDSPGGLERVLQVVDDASVSVEYLYSFAQLGGHDAVIIMHVDDTDKALSALTDAKLSMISNADLEIGR